MKYNPIKTLVCERLGQGHQWRTTSFTEFTKQNTKKQYMTIEFNQFIKSYCRYCYINKNNDRYFSLTNYSPTIVVRNDCDKIELWSMRSLFIDMLEDEL